MIIKENCKKVSERNQIDICFYYAADMASRNKIFLTKFSMEEVKNDSFTNGLAPRPLERAITGAKSFGECN